MTDDVEIIRVPQEEDRIEHSQRFPRMPILYLEYLENSKRVKPELIGKDYIPKILPEQDKHPSRDEDKHRSRDNEVDDNEVDDNEVDDNEVDDRHRLRNNEVDDLKDNENDDRSEKDLDEMFLGDSEDESPPIPEKIIEEQEVIPTSVPPTLGELRAKNQTKLRPSDYKYPLEDEEDTIKKRNDVFFHYEVLKRMHPTANIPEFNSYSDPDAMAQKYELLAKKLSLDSSVENWKRYMIIFVMGCEVGLGKLNFDMEGFAQQQIASMNTYDQLLVEMAEKSYVPSGSRWPVEVRLLMMLTMNVVLFVISKMIFKKTGTNLLGTINNLTGVNIPAEPKLRDP